MKKQYNKPIYSILMMMMMVLSAASAQEVIDLGANLEANSVSNDGNIVAGSIGDSNFIWTQTEGLQIISTLTNGYPMAGRATVSGDGTKISATITNPDTSLNEMGLYDIATETWTLLGGLAGSSDGSKSSAWAISEDGNVIGGLGWVNAGTAHGILWNETDGITDIGSTVADRSTRINALSSDGNVAAGWQDGTSGYRQGAIWVDGEQTLIFDQDGIEVGEAGAISGDGQWVVGGNAFEAYRWNAEEGLHYISHPDSGMWFQGASTAISTNGSIIVGFYRPWPGPAVLGEGFIWTEETGRVELNEYVTGLGIDDLGITFALPLGISADGTNIVGLGRTNSGGLTGFLVKLPVAVSVNEVSLTSVDYYPNPVADVLNISSEQVIENIEVYTIDGQLLLSEDIRATQFKTDFSTYSTGTYFVKIVSGSNFKTFKVIKK